MFLNGVDVSEVTDKIMTILTNYNTSGSSEINIAMEFERITNIPLVRKKVLCCYQPGSYVPG